MAAKRRNFVAKWVDVWYKEETNDLAESWFLDATLPDFEGVPARAWITKNKNEKRYNCTISVGSYRKVAKYHKALKNAKAWCNNELRRGATLHVNAYSKILDRLPVIEDDEEETLSAIEDAIKGMTL